MGTGGSGRVSVVVVMAGASLSERIGVRAGRSPGRAPGDRRAGLCRWVVLVREIGDEGQQGGVVLVVRGQPRQRGGDGVGWPRGCRGG